MLQRERFYAILYSCNALAALYLAPELIKAVRWW